MSTLVRFFALAILAATLVSVAPLPSAGAAGASCTTPGPDYAGYRCALTTYSWASMTGATSVALSFGQTSDAVGLPFGFKHFDSEYWTVWISSTGGVCFNLDRRCGDENERPLYNAGAAVFCLDAQLDPSRGGSIRYKGTSSQFTVEFSNVQLAWGASPQTFQIQLLPSGESRCMYNSVNAFGSAGATSGAGRIPGWSQSTFVAYAYQETIVATNVGVRFFCTSANPAAPADFHWINWRTPAEGQIDLYWDYPATDGCHPILYYKVFRGPDALSLSHYTDVGVDSSLMDTLWTDFGAPTEWTSASYAISAVSDRGESARTATVSFRESTPPEGITATPSDQIGSAKITWQSPVDTGGLRVAHYVLYRGPNLNDLRPVATIPGWQTSYVDNDAGFGLQFYRMSAVNGLGEGARSSSFGATGSIEPPAIFGDTQVVDLGKNTVGPFASLPITGSNCVWFDLGPITIYGSRFQNGNPSSWINPGTPLLFGDRC